jgi:UDP-glucose 4-epimerase
MKNGQPVVLVTGANGFVGRHLTPTLERNGWIVRAAVRTAILNRREILIESVGPTTDWQNALAGVDAVVHLAARVHRPHEEQAVDLYRDINVDGTLHLARSAAAAGVRQFVFISTILVHGRSSDGRAPFSESDTLSPRGVYGRSKAAAESELESMAQDDGMCVTVIRPPLVYGAGAKGNFKLLAQAVRRGIPLPLGSIRNRRAFVSVQNLGSFILQRLLHANQKFDVFLIADNEQVSTPEFIMLLARAAGTKARLFGISTVVLNSLLKLSGRQEVRDSLIGSLELNLAKVASTGWRPPIALDEGLYLAMNDSNLGEN